MGLFGRNKKGGLMDVIRCDEPSYLIWKWHPAGSLEKENHRENAIRWGSSLRVKDGEVAVFVYNQKNGITQDFIEGPFDEKIKTENLPILANIIGLAYDGESPFQAEIYFINLSKIIQIKFGVPYFDVFDPRFTDFSVPLAVRGVISFKITDYREFVKLHRLITFSLNDFQIQIRDVVIRYIKEVVTNVPAAHNIPVIQIETKIGLLNDEIEYNIKNRLYEDFGVTVSGVDISAIEIDKSSDGYHSLMDVTRGVETATIQASKEAAVKNIHDKQRVDIENYQEVLRIQREEDQYARHKNTQSDNFAAYQVESQTKVGVAGAEAFGKMEAKGAGNINLGSNGTGFNPAAMMAGMTMGSAIGQNIAGVMNGTMSKINNPVSTPPPIPQPMYYIAIDGQPQGPYDITTLRQMVVNHQFDKNKLVWKAGMENWILAADVKEIQILFQEDDVIPPIPPIPRQI